MSQAAASISDQGPGDEAAGHAGAAAAPPGPGAHGVEGRVGAPDEPRRSGSTRFRGAIVRRLLLGPVLVAALAVLVLLDERVAGTPLPAALWWLAQRDGTAAPGLLILAAGLLVCGRAAIEIARMYRAAGLQASRGVVIIAALAGVIAGGLAIGTPDRLPGGGATPGGTILASGALLVVLLALVVHTRTRVTRGACGAAGSALMCFTYSGIALGFLMALRTDYSAYVVLAVVLTAKSCDIGAYFTGHAIGRRKLIPWLSPGKTWEGFVGGTVVAGSVGAALGWAAASVDPAVSGLSAIPAFGPWHGLGAGLLMGVTAQLGDLIASILKRDAGIKDSGRLLPGFGGVVDVIDSLLLAGPAAFWCFRLMRSLGG